MLEVIVDFIKTSRKAIVAFAITAIVSYLSKKGLSVEPELQQSAQIFFEAVIAGVLVWLVPNKTKK